MKTKTFYYPCIEHTSDCKNEPRVFQSYLFITPCKHVVCREVLKTKAKRLQMYIKGQIKQSASIKMCTTFYITKKYQAVLDKYTGYSTQNSIKTRKQVQRVDYGIIQCRPVSSLVSTYLYSQSEENLVRNKITVNQL